METTRKFATKLIFASPSIKNPELFLQLFERATDGSLAVQERTVAQQRYFVDLVDRKQYYLSGDVTKDEAMDRAPSATSPVELVTSLSSDRKSIVYINSSAKAAKFALKLAEELPEVSDERLDSLIKFVKEHVHNDYYLARTLKHGVAFHHGKMPQDVRERVEACFSDQSSKLKYVACTSTLLEGVNLPAKNIFVLNETHGSSRFGKIDFENLAGRAGRLTYDFSGNVICVRSDKSTWEEPSRDLIPRGEPVVADSFLVNPGNKRKDFTDIGRVLREEDLPKGTSDDAKRSVQQYASILISHVQGNQQTSLRSLFLEKVKDAPRLLAKAVEEFPDERQPQEILRRSPGILPKYQAEVWNSLREGTLGPLAPSSSEDLNYELFREMLTRLGSAYNWIKEESGGRDPLVPAKQDGYEARIRYWATLMSYWVKGEPLALVIGRAIRYYTKQGEISYRDFSISQYLITEKFDPSDARQLNIVIEETMRDLETGLRFKIISYLENYYDLCVEALGEEAAGLNVAKLVEYGTSDARVINLQEVGFSRAAALDLAANYTKYLRFTAEDELDSVQVEALLAEAELDESTKAEIENILHKEG